MPDEIRAHVGRLGVNAATESRENTDETGAQRETDQTLHRQVVPDHLARDGIENGHGEKGQADDEKAGDRATIEGHAHGERARTARGLRGADVRQHGDAHADVTSRERAGGADQEAQRCRRILGEEQR